MKNYSRIISIMLAMMMVLTSLSIAFAVDEVEQEGDPTGEPAAVTEEPAPVEAPVVEEEPTVQEEAPVEAPVVEEESTGQEEVTKRSLKALREAPAEYKVTVKVNYVYDVTIKDKAGTDAADPVTQEIILEKDEEGNYIDTAYSIEQPSPAITGYAPDREVVEGIVPADYAEQGITEITEVVTYKAVPTGPVTNLKLHPSYKSIILTWDRVPDAKEYLILRSTSAKPTDDTFVKYAVVKNSNSKTIRFEDLKANGAVGDFHLARWYFYRVYAISQSGRSSKGIWINGTAVRPMYEKITFKAGVTLQPHGGQWKSHYFRAGQKVMAQGFGGGKFIFWYKGTKYYANYVRVKNCTAEYVSNSKSKSYSGIWATQRYASGDATGTKVNFNGIKCYDKTSAERFVNLIGKGSGSKYLIWVSTYHQHVYVFQGKKGAWKLIKDWECATGAAESPTPTGAEKRLERRVSYRHGVRWWRPFQTWNSIHGKLQSWSMGGPASNGCVRNFDQNAKWIYDNCPNGTGLIVW